MGIINNLKIKSKQTAIVTGADYIVKYMQKDPQKNFDTAMKRLAMIDAMFKNQGQFKAFMDWIRTHEGTRQWFINLLSCDPEQVRIFVKNFLGNCSLAWIEKAEAIEDRYGFCPPYNIIISPTMRCNLKCRGCYAADYTMKDDMDLATIEKIITEGKELGVYFYTILGGEPFIRFDDLETMALTHKDCLFQIFTNGTLITEDVAERLLNLKNIVVVFSINGTREDTDYMRGDGVYDKVLQGVERLKARKLLYGISLVLTSRNYETLMSREFLKFWEKQGGVFGWNFLFMPVGPQPDLSLMPTPEQRVGFGEFIKRYREEEPMYIMDFWADAPAVHGCISGGRRFLHINNKGDIEPCIFAHFSTHNIQDTTLIEAMQSPFFTFIRMNQPHTDNMLRPCMIIDNPSVLREACARCHARPTDAGAAQLIGDPAIMQAIDEYAAQTARVVDPIWNERYRHKIDEMYRRRCAYGEGIDRIEYKLNRLGFLEKIKAWSQQNPTFARNMLESLEYSYTHYGTDRKRHLVSIRESSKPEGDKSSDLPSQPNA